MLHFLLPSLAPLALVALWLTSKATFGCANRGFTALGVVLLSSLAAGATALRARVLHKRRSREEHWWTLTTLLLILPIALLLGPLR